MLSCLELNIMLLWLYIMTENCIIKYVLLKVKKMEKSYFTELYHTQHFYTDKKIDKYNSHLDNHIPG